LAKRSAAGSEAHAGDAVRRKWQLERRRDSKAGQPARRSTRVTAGVTRDALKGVPYQPNRHEVTKKTKSLLEKIHRVFVAKSLELEGSAELQRSRIGERRPVTERRTRCKVHRPECIAVESVQQIDSCAQLLRVEFEHLGQ